MPIDENIIRVSTDFKSLGDLRKEITLAKDNLFKLTNEFGKNSEQARLAGEKLKIYQGYLRDGSNTIKEFGLRSKVSGAQILEIGENLTIVTAGLIQLGRALKETVFEGAEFGVLKDKFIEFEGGIDRATQKLELLRQASAGNLNEKSLIEYSNKMKLLGFSTDQTAKFLDIVERKADELGVTFDTGKQALESYIITGRGRGLKELGINIADVTSAMEKQTGLIKEQIGKLEEEDQQYLRSSTILRLYGNDITQINAKQKDTADRLNSIKTALENTKLEMGNFIANGIIKLADALGATDAAVTGTATKIAGIGSELGKLFPIIAGLKIAFPGAMAVMSGSVFPVVAGIIAVGAQMLALQKLLDSWKPFGMKSVSDLEDEKSAVDDFNKTEERQKQTVQDAIKRNQEKFTQFQKEKEFQETIAKTLDKQQKVKTTGQKHFNTLKQEEVKLEEILTGFDAERSKAVQLRYNAEKAILNIAGEGRTGKGGLGTASQGQSPEELASQQADTIKSAFDQSLSLASQISGFLGQGANQIISAFQTAYSIIQAIVELIRTINMASSLLNFIPGGGIIGGIIKATGATGAGGSIRGMLGNTMSGNRGGFNGNIIVMSEIERAKGIKVFNKYGSMAANSLGLRGVI